MACKVAFVGMVLAFVAVGCADEEPEPTVDPDAVVTIEQGVYGKATLTSCTEEECFESADADAPARVFRGDVDNDTSDAPVAQTVTDDRGFFELELEPGEYSLCVDSFHQLPCVVFTLTSGERERIDFAG